MYSRQPNGKYCRFSTIVDNFTHHNLTERDLEGMLGKSDAKFLVSSTVDTDIRCFHLWPFDFVKKQVRPGNDTLNNVREKLKEMGDNDWETFEYHDWEIEERKAEAIAKRLMREDTNDL